ncbi:uncharacterized protein LOC129593885 isoform X2 [Paramacrobiotus metropolitanus]|nr:uncharacterized protein LOC129593885 isoform X2 [Paramacrobiotus metropolitanus]
MWGEERALGAQIVQELQTQEVFMDLWKHMDTMESMNASLLVKLQAVTQENEDLRDQLEHAQKELGVAQDNIAQLETDKQELDFLYQLKVSECDELNARISEEFDDAEQRIFSLEPFSPRSKPRTNSGSKRTPLISGSGVQTKTSVFRQHDYKENSPSARMPLTDVGNLTMRFNGLANQTLGTDDIDLEELTDKLSWYESVVRQLHTILAVEMDDPDATYHQECTKVLERAKRAMEYRDIIRDYEVMIGESKGEIERLRQTRDSLLEEAEKSEKENKEKVEKLERARDHFFWEVKKVEAERKKMEAERRKDIERLHEFEKLLQGKTKKSVSVNHTFTNLLPG